MGNSYQRIVGLRPADLIENELYVVPAATELIGILTICNQDSSNQLFSVAITNVSGAAGSGDWIESETLLLATMAITLQPITLTVGQTIRVKAGVVDKISFVLTGLLIT